MRCQRDHHIHGSSAKIESKTDKRTIEIWRQERETEGRNPVITWFFFTTPFAFQAVIVIHKMRSKHSSGSSQHSLPILINTKSTVGVKVLPFYLWNFQKESEKSHNTGVRWYCTCSFISCSFPERAVQRPDGCEGYGKHYRGAAPLSNLSQLIHYANSWSTNPDSQTCVCA